MKKLESSSEGHHGSVQEHHKKSHKKEEKKHKSHEKSKKHLKKEEKEKDEAKKGEKKEGEKKEEEAKKSKSKKSKSSSIDEDHKHEESAAVASTLLLTDNNEQQPTRRSQPGKQLRSVAGNQPMLMSASSSTFRPALMQPASHQVAPASQTLMRLIDANYDDFPPARNSHRNLSFPEPQNQNRSRSSPVELQLNRFEQLMINSTDQSSRRADFNGRQAKSGTQNATILDIVDNFTGRQLNKTKIGTYELEDQLRLLNQSNSIGKLHNVNIQKPVAASAPKSQPTQSANEAILMQLLNRAYAEQNSNSHQLASFQQQQDQRPIMSSQMQLPAAAFSEQNPATAQLFQLLKSPSMEANNQHLFRVSDAQQLSAASLPVFGLPTFGVGETANAFQSDQLIDYDNEPILSQPLRAILAR